MTQARTPTTAVTVMSVEGLDDSISHCARSLSLSIVNAKAASAARANTPHRIDNTAPLQYVFIILFEYLITTLMFNAY